LFITFVWPRNKVWLEIHEFGNWLAEIASSLGEEFFLLAVTHLDFEESFLGSLGTFFASPKSPSLQHSVFRSLMYPE
jgi:hypothetical protein